MPIENKTWVTGEVITAEDLNKITPLVVVITDKEDGGFITNVTFRDIKNASEIGKPIFGVYKTVEEYANFTNIWLMLTFIEVTNAEPGVSPYTVYMSDSELQSVTFVGLSLDDTLETSGIG